MANRTQASDQTSSRDEELRKTSRRPRRRPAAAVGRRGQKGKRRGLGAKGRGQKEKRRGQEERSVGVTVKRMWSGGKRQYCVFCRRPQVKIARHLLRKHGDEPEVTAASALPTGSKQRHLLLEHLRCRGNYLHNIEVIRQGSGEIVPCRQPSEEVDARNYLPCPLCLGFFLRSDLWKHQASCRKKLASDASKDDAPGSQTTSHTASETTSQTASQTTSHTASETATESRKDSTSGSSDDSEDPLSDRYGLTTDQTRSKQPMTSDPGANQSVTSDPGANQSVTSDPAPRKRNRVQAAASRLLPISGGASESCSEILHRMNQDHISHQVKSDWLICKYGNKLMGSQDGGQKRYDYVSQKLRELGRFLLAAKSLDSGVQNLQDVLAPGRLSLALAAARKASGYRWSRPPLAVKTTLKTVCEIAIGESLQDGDWEAAAKTTDFYHKLGREWDNLGLLNPDPDTDPDLEGVALKRRPVQSKNKSTEPGQEPDSRPEALSKSETRLLSSTVPPGSRLQTPGPVPVPLRKVRRRPWSSAEKEAVWRQLGDHVLFQTVPGKEVCQRCLDLEPVLRGRHWKDIKNQVHNQIQSQKKQQFHAQMDLEENQDQQNQEQDQVQNQKRQQQRYQGQMDQGKDHTQNQKKDQYHAQVDHPDQDHTHNQKKQQYHMTMDHQVHVSVHKKQLYQLEQQTPGLQTTLDRDTSLLTGTAYGPDGSHRAPGQSLMEQDPIISPYPLTHRAPGSLIDQLLPRTEWTDESLPQNYPVNRTGQEPAPGHASRWTEPQSTLWTHPLLKNTPQGSRAQTS